MASDVWMPPQKVENTWAYLIYRKKPKYCTSLFACKLESFQRFELTKESQSQCISSRGQKIMKTFLQQLQEKSYFPMTFKVKVR